MEIGATNAIISKVTTLIDGSVRVSLDIQDIEIAQKLLKLYVIGDPLIHLGIVKVDE